MRSFVIFSFAVTICCLLVSTAFGAEDSPPKNHPTHPPSPVEPSQNGIASAVNFSNRIGSRLGSLLDRLSNVRAQDSTNTPTKTTTTTIQ